MDKNEQCLMPLERGLFDSRPRRRWPAPSDGQCRAWWDAYAMPEHIRRHSLVVADVCEAVARRGADMGLEVDVQAARASALLHDLAKMFTVENGGSHAQIGAAWAMELTGNPILAQGILHHVYWPFELDVVRYFTPLVVLYGDKRAKHDELVRVGDRFTDLLERYGSTSDLRGRIRQTLDQAIELENALSELLEVDLDACTFTGGRLVQRT